MFQNISVASKLVSKMNASLLYFPVVYRIVNGSETGAPFLANLSLPTVRPARDEKLALAEVTVLGVIFIAASVGNTAMVLTLWRRRKKLSRMYVFMLHLSIADLVVAFFQVLPQLVWDITDVFLGPDPLCRSMKYLQLVGMFASTYMIVAMTIDRFQAVCYPMVTFQRKRALCNAPICISWSFSLIFSIPQFFIFSKTEIGEGVFQCWGEFIQPWGLKTYITWIFVVIFLIPTAILTICQMKIYKSIQTNAYIRKPTQPCRRNPKQITALPSRVSNTNCISKAMIKTVKMTVVTVVVYVICWTPFFIVQLWSVWHPSDITEGPEFTIIMLLGNLNSCTNPWIYMYFCGHIPCCEKHSEIVLIQEESLVTATINLGDKELDDIMTAV
ncbi:isotocin receptor-like [Protopterus annectens]|uniref:isotocin receptor-like n=1 Tax=Protopterus annectens TaxID=7888 RepID=UPI001CFAFAA1|nr:isotocin receptor-like [Protopterus annectens]